MKAEHKTKEEGLSEDTKDTTVENTDDKKPKALDPPNMSTWLSPEEAREHKEASARMFKGLKENLNANALEDQKEEGSR